MADLYFKGVNFLQYFNQSNCGLCGQPSCGNFVEALEKKGQKPKDCPFITQNQIRALELVLEIGRGWPQTPLLSYPSPVPIGLLELNNPDARSLVIVSGNNKYTQQTLMYVMQTTSSPFFLLFADTDGNTIDMSMVYGSLTAEKIHKILKETGIEERVSRREILIPGFARSLKEGIERLTGWSVIVGPVCAAEIPLFLCDEWFIKDTGV